MVMTHRLPVLVNRLRGVIPVPQQVERVELDRVVPEEAVAHALTDAAAQPGRSHAPGPAATVQ